MSWTVTPTQLLADDQDALTYLTAVEAADGQALESGVRLAVNAFVKGCKADGIWPAIKASCILAGARTLAGSLVPLVGTAPTNNNFVSGDYNRKTGLLGDAVSKRLAQSITVTAGMFHGAVYKTANETADNQWLYSNSNTNASASRITSNAGNITYRPFGTNTIVVTTASRLTGFIGQSISGSAASYRHPGASGTGTAGTATLTTTTFQVFGGTSIFSDARMSFYSFGESLNLALLDARVTTLVNALSAAIP